MHIACTNKDVAWQVRNVLKLHASSRRVNWQEPSAIDDRIWVVVNVDIDAPEEATIRRHIEAIAGATVHD